VRGETGEGDFFPACTRIIREVTGRDAYETVMLLKPVFYQDDARRAI